MLYINSKFYPIRHKKRTGDFMDLKKTILKTLGMGFLATAFMAFFLALILFSAQPKLDELGARIKAEYPDKLLGIMELVITPEMRQILTVENMRLVCGMKNSMNFTNLIKDLPVNIEYINPICANIDKVNTITDMKRIFTSTIVNGFIDDEGYFPEIKKRVGEYSENYLPILAIACIVLYIIAGLIFWLANGNPLIGLHTLMFHTAISAIFYIIGFGIIYVLINGIVSSVVMNQSEIVKLLSSPELPAQFQDIAQTFISDSINFVCNWIKEILIQFILIYGLIAILSGGIWIGISIISKKS